MPIDFSNRDDVTLLVSKLINFVKRGLALRIGIVPIVRNDAGTTNARIFTYLFQNYDLVAARNYFNDALESLPYGVRAPGQEYIDNAVKNRPLSPQGNTKTMNEILADKDLALQQVASGHWAARMSIHQRPYPYIINGQSYPFGDDWINILTGVLPQDVVAIQRGLRSSRLTDSDDPAAFLLGEKPLMRRSNLIFPDDEKDIKILNLFDLYEEYPEIFNNLPHVTAQVDENTETTAADIWVIGDFDEPSGHQLLSNAAQLQFENPQIGITAISNSAFKTQVPTLSVLLHHLAGKEVLRKPGILKQILEEIKPQQDHVEVGIEQQQQVLGDVAKAAGWGAPDNLAAEKFWKATADVLRVKLNIQPGEQAVILNGRILGPFKNQEFTFDDFQTLYQSELPNRITPYLKAAESLKLLTRFRADNYRARMTSVLNLMQKTTESTGFISRTSNIRTNKYNKLIAKKTAHRASDTEWSIYRVIVSLDPLSEVAQKWAPILRVLMALDGVGIITYLNPREELKEVPIKRFYRHVLYPSPKFDENGEILYPKAQFIDLPPLPLLSLGLDVPPSWLVTPEQTIHDLDNIKIQIFKDRFGTPNLNSTYVLRNILIEGHSRDTSLNEPSAGAQLELGTTKHPVIDDTLIMQNLGYFQFKSNPGHYQIRLKPGRSSDIFSIQSLGTEGWSSNDAAEDDLKEVSVTSLRGVTLFPRLKRNRGYMQADVFAPNEHESTVDKGVKAATGLLAKLGIMKAKEVDAPPKPAEINIFSVASGHLYERFLNIMMVSVMRHTKHTVKFWFIENFLSPAFKVRFDVHC